MAAEKSWYNRAMNRCLPFLLLALFLTAVSFQSRAAGSFYSATIPVVDHSQGEKNRAMREALEEVLVKLTGRSDIASDPAASALLADASAYALEFGYVDMEQEGEQGLSVTFTAGQIDDYLRRQRLPIWPRKRTPVLMWVTLEAGGEPLAFLTPEEAPEVYEELGRRFQRRGMPVRYPLYDFEDQLNLPVEEAWRLNTEQVAMASNRYGTDRWLIVRCYQTSAGNWRLAWRLGGEDQRATLQSLEAESLEQGMDRVVARAVDLIAADYAYIPNPEASGLTVEVAGIGDYPSYKKLSRLMAGLSMVKSYRVTRVTPLLISLQLEIDGDRQQFVDALKLYDQLTLVENQSTGRLALNWRSSAF